MVLILCTFDFLCDVCPVDDVEKNVSCREENHTGFIHQSDSSLGHVHTKRVAIDTELQVGPEFAERADLLDTGILFGGNLFLLSEDVFLFDSLIQQQNDSVLNHHQDNEKIARQTVNVDNLDIADLGQGEVNVVLNGSHGENAGDSQEDTGRRVFRLDEKVDPR